MAGGWVSPQAHDEETLGMESLCAGALWQSRQRQVMKHLHRAVLCLSARWDPRASLQADMA